MARRQRDVSEGDCFKETDSSGLERTMGDAASGTLRSIAPAGIRGMAVKPREMPLRRGKTIGTGETLDGCERF